MAVVVRQFAFDEQTIRELKVVMERLRNKDTPVEQQIEDTATAMAAMQEFLDTLDVPPAELAN